MADIGMPDSFEGKLGPLPVWVWGAIVGCGVVAYVWFSNRADGGTEVDADTTSGEETKTTASLSDAIDGAFTMGTASGSTLATADITETVDSNTAWGLRATSYLVTQGISPVTAQRAINAYLNGDAMTSEQSGLVDRAIIGIGQPPTAVKINAGVAASSTYSRYYRTATGQIKGVTASGSEADITDDQYISLGMPALSSDGYQTKYYKAASSRTTVAYIAAKYHTTVSRLIVINKWKTIPVLKKGSKVKVPA